MNDPFAFDVFLSHSSKDKETVRPIAERLKADGLRVWLDSWEIRPGDSIPAKIEEGLEHSRVLVLCMSKNAFGSDWPQLEAGTFRFRDPLNKDRRFVPLRIDSAPIKGSLAQFLYINWFSEDHEDAYSKLFEACRLRTTRRSTKIELAWSQPPAKELRLDCALPVWTFTFAADGEHVLTADHEGSLRLWNVETGDCLQTLAGHVSPATSVAWSADGHHALSGGMDGAARFWNLKTGRRLRVLRGSKLEIWSVALSNDRLLACSGSRGGPLLLWNLKTRQRPLIFKGHTSTVLSLARSM
jgi:hypothetical protein